MCIACERDGHFEFGRGDHSFSCVVEHIDHILKIFHENDGSECDGYIFNMPKLSDGFDGGYSKVAISTLEFVKGMGTDKMKALLHSKDDDLFIRYYCSKVLKGEL